MTTSPTTTTTDTHTVTVLFNRSGQYAVYTTPSATIAEKVRYASKADFGWVAGLGYGCSCDRPYSPDCTTAIELRAPLDDNEVEVDVTVEWDDAERTYTLQRTPATTVNVDDLLADLQALRTTARNMAEEMRQEGSNASAMDGSANGLEWAIRAVQELARKN